MEKKKLTKEMLDKVRHIEGFPKGKDEDIIELSDPPYYTACPNPFIQDFIDEHGTLYDEETDDYHREPFASDVSEGKNDPIYNAHSYHTKVPHKAIMRYILHYTAPGDIVFDGFCGTGMTGVAAQMCEDPDPQFKMKIKEEMGKVKWGGRKAILGDLSPVASFITYSLNTSINIQEFNKETNRLIRKLNGKYGWMYETNHVQKGNNVNSFAGIPVKGRVNYIVWSDVFLCPQCSQELVFWDIAVNEQKGKIQKKFICQLCGVELKKKDLERKWITIYDDCLEKTINQAKQAPVLISYSVEKKRYKKVPDQDDLNLINKIRNMKIPYWIPINELPKGYNTEQPKKSHGITNAHHFYTKRNLFLVSALYDLINREGLTNKKKLFFTSFIDRHVVNRNRWLLSGPTRPLNNTLYVPDLKAEVNVLEIAERKVKDIIKAKKESYFFDNEKQIITTQSTTELPSIGANKIDYIFIDPPFGQNIMYSEVNYVWESWLKVFTNNLPEAIINKNQKKGLYEYQELMERCFNEMHRILKPERWMTLVFHNSKNIVWNAIQDALQKAGFIVADVRVFDKKQGTIHQDTKVSGTVKKDLIVSSYKPKKSFMKKFNLKAGSEEGVWEFVSQHLNKLPVVVEKDDLLNIVAERQNHLLYDRMVAFHIQNGYSVPMGVAEFYQGLKNKFLERDSMYFLPNQVAEYDKTRLQVKGVGQLSLFIMDEKSAIQWLRSKLEEEPLTYQEIQPDFMREANFFRHEKGLELQELLEQNFLQDDERKWYVPDPNKQADLEKMREKILLREFQEYKEGKGKLKKFRSEAVRVGFKDCWSKGDYKTIIEIAKRIPDKVLQEDVSLLMYYNNALTREGQK